MYAAEVLFVISHSIHNNFNVVAIQYLVTVHRGRIVTGSYGESVAVYGSL